MAEVNLAFADASRQPDLVILLGIKPESPDEEYGWIEPDREASTNKSPRLWRVRRFWEKPSSVLARELMERGCMWNSFVMVGTVSAFLKIVRLSTGDLYRKFAATRSKMSTPSEKSAIQTLYDDLTNTNFSREVLQRRPGDLAVVRVDSSKWSDLGSPRRVFATLSELGEGSLTKHEPTTHLMKLPEGNYEKATVCSREVF